MATRELEPKVPEGFDKGSGSQKRANAWRKERTSAIGTAPCQLEKRCQSDHRARPDADGYLWIGTTHGIFRFDGICLSESFGIVLAS